MKEHIATELHTILSNLGVEHPEVSLVRPGEDAHGEYMTNAALVHGKALGKNPKGFAQEICAEFQKHMPEGVAKAEVAGPGFINFSLTDKAVLSGARAVIEKGEDYGKNTHCVINGEPYGVMVEYTQPNPFKPFHIGHLMSNTIGESLSRIIEFSGARVFRANYQGDVGLHVAKALFGMQAKGYDGSDVLKIGEAYAYGNAQYEENEAAQKEIVSINKQVYEGLTGELAELYARGRETSLAHFEELYKALGTTFDRYFFESETWKRGAEIVKEHTGDVFTESEGAVVFKGEDYGLHTRVFITKDGVPTYEAKDIGLAELKAKTFPFDLSITTTAVEQKEYFQVIFKALALLFPELSGKFVCITHGLLTLPSGKMSSRTGSVVTGESLLSGVRERALLKMATSGGMGKDESVATMVAVAAIKYTVLKQAVHKNMVFDEKEALSFEGDSGPYLQYTHARAKSLLDKSEAVPMIDTSEKAGALARLLLYFPEVVERAGKEYAPQYITTYLIELARTFNAEYAKEKVIGSPREAHLLALAAATAQVLKNGLYLLGITAPERM